MTESALSDEADALYQRLGGIEPWAAVEPGGVPVLGLPTAGDDLAWAELVARGALLATAHQSGALDGMHGGDRAIASALLRGRMSLGEVTEDVRAHVHANFEALQLAQMATHAELRSERWMRKVHAVACRPQLTHPVRGEGGVHDHVLATGDFKHHPNHSRSRSGTWTAHAPVSVLATEMGRFLDVLGSEAFAALAPVVQAAYADHGLTHVAPFADGNGRVARVVAGAHLLASAAVPLLIWADQASDYEDVLVAADAGDAAALVGFVAERCRDTVELVGALRSRGPSSPDEAAALGRWRARADAAAVLAVRLPGWVDDALGRHRRRADLGWLSPLSDATATVDTSGSVVVREPETGVDERIEVDTHPVLDEDTLVLQAVEARLRLPAEPGELRPSVSHTFRSRCDAWLDRTVTTLALRVAAEED
ncbi:MAG TPA: Fic family protein [Acidimicrobiales bacterium]|nr:Fic family protein [Acidimicrobiales bacterium]